MSPVRGAATTMPSASQFCAIPFGAGDSVPGNLSHPSKTGSGKFYIAYILRERPYIVCNPFQTTLWKGIGSSFLVRGMSLGVEDLLSKVTPWPKELTAHTTTKQFVQHICLKCISFALVMPFYCASLVETVQSDIASEKPGFLDVFREGGLRLLNWSAPKKGRMVPVWILIGPSIGLHLGKYIFGYV